MELEEEIKEKMNYYIQKLGADPSFLPELNNSNYYAKPFIETDNDRLQYVCYERDKELFSVTFRDIDSLLYQVFKDITNELALDWEVNNRKPEQDFRRRYFYKAIELMYKLEKSYGSQLELEIRQFLKSKRFNDRMRHCSSCLLIELDGFESEEQFNILDLRLTKLQNNLGILVRKNTSLSQEIAYRDAPEEYYCKACQSSWELSAPNFPWKGYMKRIDSNNTDV